MVARDPHFLQTNCWAVGTRVMLPACRFPSMTYCAPMGMVPKPFRLEIPEAAIADLRERLARSRFPDEPPLEAWSTGTSLAYLKELVHYWQSSFDWRVQEATLNAFRQYTVA